MMRQCHQEKKDRQSGGGRKGARKARRRDLQQACTSWHSTKFDERTRNCERSSRRTRSVRKEHTVVQYKKSVQSSPYTVREQVARRATVQHKIQFHSTKSKTMRLGCGCVCEGSACSAQERVVCSNAWQPTCSRKNRYSSMWMSILLENV